MPRLTKVCQTPGCPELQPCPTHAPKPWAGANGTQRRQQRGITGTGWAEQARNERILRRDGHACQIRGPRCTGRATEVDHRIPLAAGGPDTAANKQAACANCHADKTRTEKTRG